MGDPRKTRKHFKRPLKIWDTASLEREKALTQTYGLKNKKEIWRTETMLRKKRDSARSLLALDLEDRMKREKELLQSLAKLGILDQNATLDDVLTLTIESFLERRLQSIVWRKGLANTAKQARQFITHGHITVAGGKVTAPGYLVNAEEENKTGYYAGKKMALRPPEKEKPEKAGKEGKKTETVKKGKKTTKEEFEEAKPAESKGKEKTGEEREERPKEGKPEKEAKTEERKERPKEEQTKEKKEEKKKKTKQEKKEEPKDEVGKGGE